MKVREVKLGLVLIALVISPLSFAKKVIYYGSETELVKVRYPGPILLRFDSEVETISDADLFEIAPTNSENPNYANLSVRPRFTRGTSRVAFILSDGSTVELKLKTVKSKSLEDGGEDLESVYELRSKEKHLEHNRSEKGGKTVTALELLKAIVRGDRVNGYSTKTVNKKVSSPTRGVSAQLVKVYTGSMFNGYVFRLTNSTSKKFFEVNVAGQKLGEPNQAIFVHVTNPVLRPKKSTGDSALLYVVAKSSSAFRDLVLPVAEMKAKRG